MLAEFITSWPSASFIIQGAVVTLKYSIIAVFFGLIIGIFLALFKMSKHFAIRTFAHIYTSIFRGTPVLIQLSIIYFGMPSLIDIKFNIFTAGVLTFSLNSGAYVSEIIRAGIEAVDKGQFDAARALGIPQSLMMKDIILPQAIRTILPSLINELINLIKESAIISMIGEMDIMRRAQMISVETYNFFIPMCIAAATYYFLVLVISYLSRILEKKLA
ncbi:Putative amino acid ABC transporter permease [Candidatus Trichorickettsia mobilis]|uniref:Putative glutamine transport system permease protein GlnP n=1 Tax=Candidatus Trichorickettsia mobilis TaxID=1346319 RepID=A0ABZ0URV0_9RICK|nr:amino acid ABC transporter permease [Candidatus Trichorickettsia mobilis]WPY00767.1 Putative amino acid ABC transporter permease [Candidatus Trichorickettsia mobilis]